MLNLECRILDVPVFASALSRAACYAACLGVGESRRRMAFGNEECLHSAGKEKAPVSGAATPGGILGFMILDLRFTKGVGAAA